MSCSDETNTSSGGNKGSSSSIAQNVDTTTGKTNLLVSSTSSSSTTTLNKTLYGTSRANKVQLSSTADPHSMLSAEAVEVLDKMREGADILRNNTNSFLSGELLASSLLVGTGQQSSPATSIGSYSEPRTNVLFHACTLLFIVNTVFTRIIHTFLLRNWRLFTFRSKLDSICS